MFPTGQRGESLPYAIEILQDPTGVEFLWVADGSSGRILKYDLAGNYVYGWGTPGNDYGHFNGRHSITTDQDGNLYIAEVFAGRIQSSSRGPVPTLPRSRDSSCVSGTDGRAGLRCALRLAQLLDRYRAVHQSGMDGALVRVRPSRLSRDDPGERPIRSRAGVPDPKES